MKDLAICIPAYNRPQCLIELLQTIVNQINDSNRSRVEICISDDCSPCDLRTPVTRFMENHDVSYVFHRNEKNLGFDLNVLNSVSLASARYCWIFGDDDGVPPGRINMMLEYFDKYPDINVFFGNRYVCNRKLKIMMKERWTKDKDDFYVDFTDDNEIKAYFDKLNTTTCLGYFAVIVKKEAWDSITEEEYRPYTKTIYIQVAKYLMILYKKGKLYRISDYIALSRFGHDNFFNSLKQRIFMDYYGFLQLSEIFNDNAALKDSFLGIVRRHYDNVFLNAMSYTAQLNDDEIETLRKVGYTGKQISIFTKRNRVKALFGFIIAVIKSIFTDFFRFWKTCRVTMQKFLK